MLYETLGPELTMAAPALLMRNTDDDPTWTALVYHDHVSWFPGGAYVVEKLFREHYAERYLTSTSGTFRDLPNRRSFFDDISQMKPEAWQPGTVDAIVTSSTDGRRIVIKAVNYDGVAHTTLVRLQGSRAPADAAVRRFTVSANPNDAATLQQPNRIAPAMTSMPYAKDLAIDLPAYSVAVVEIAAR
jgi:alpha-N-arabinofuranosidase